MVLWLCQADVLSVEVVGSPRVGQAKKGDLTPTAHLSFIALGAVPRRRYQTPDGVGVERKRGAEAFLLPPLEGAVPPLVLYYRSRYEAMKINEGNPASTHEEGGSDGGVEKSGWSKLRVGFNRGVIVSEVVAGVSLVFYTRQAGKEGKYVEYVKLPALLPGSQVLCFLSSSNRGLQPWKSPPKISKLNLHAKALRDKNLLVRNFSDQAVSFAVEKGAAHILAPGQRKSYRLEGVSSSYRMLAMAKQPRRAIMNTSVRVPEGSLTVIVFFKASPKTQAGKSVGVFRLSVQKRED